MTYVACERGVESTTVAQVVARAGVSRRTFYDLFDDVGDCFLAAFDEAVARACERVTPAYQRQRRWVDGIRAGLAELLVFFDEEPQLARLCVVQALAGGPHALQRRTEILHALTGVLDQGATLGRARRVPSLTGEGLVGAVLAVIHARLLEGGPAGGGPPRLTGLSGPLMGMIVLPYLGPAAAATETSRPALRAQLAPGNHSAPDPLEGLGMRLTYRTLRVLAVIAEYPGISNRELAKHAGITDQGQSSKLLARLERLQLIHNSGEGHTKGASNAWNLTPRGANIHAALDTHTS